MVLTKKDLFCLAVEPISDQIEFLASLYCHCIRVHEIILQRIPTTRNQESGILPPKTHSVCFRKQPEGMWRAKQSSNLWARELFAIDSRIYRLCHYCHLPGLAFFSLNSCSWLCKLFRAEYVTVIFWSKKYVGIIGYDDIVFPTRYSVIFINMTSDVTLLAKS